jgi:hypothetical protein
MAEYHKAYEATPPNLNLGHRLSPGHLKYLSDRGIAEDVARAAGYFTASSRKEHPEVFSERQRRRHPSLIAPRLSPDGSSVGFQKRDDRPVEINGKTLKWVSPPAERCKPVLGVHPWLLGEVRASKGPLWAVEGLTRALALAGLGTPAVGYDGCYSWQRGGTPLSCWDHVNLRGRLVYDVPDADARTNQNVQNAQAARVAYLESRGAKVLCINVPEVNGDEHAGLDDYIAAGYDVATLASEARPFEPVDVGPERLTKDEELRMFIEMKLEELDELPARKIGECGALKVARYMVEVAAPKHGKLKDGGVVVHPSIRQIAAGVRVGVKSTYKALERLEEEEFLEAVDEPRARHKARSYLLPIPLVDKGALGKHMREGAYKGEGSKENKEGENPHTNGKLYAGVSLMPPPLRNSKVVHTWERQGGRRVVVHSDFYKRYGAKREAIIRHVLESESVGLDDLHAKFDTGSAKPHRFFRIWIKPMVDDEVLVVDRDHVAMAPNWEEALDFVRARTGEELDNRLQDQRYARQRRAYRKARDLGPVDEESDLMGKDRTAEIVKRAAERDHEARIEEQRRKVGMTVEVFLADTLRGASGFAWRELRVLWMGMGGKTEHLRYAIKNPYGFRRDPYGDLYVVRVDPEPEPGEASAPKHGKPKHGKPKHGKPKHGKPKHGVYVHDAFCDCDWCSEPLQTGYARVR